MELFFHYGQWLMTMATSTVVKVAMVIGHKP